MERQLSCRLTIVKIENASETLSVLNWIKQTVTKALVISFCMMVRNVFIENPT